MSNIVKWNYIKFDESDKLKIDSDNPEGRISSKDSEIVYRDDSVESIMKGLQIKTAQDIADAFKENNEDVDFREGMNVINYDKMMEEERKRIALEADSLISDANEEAQRLVQEALEQADAIKNEAHTVGKNEGYEAGIKEAQASVDTMKAKIREQEAELVRKQASLEQEYLNRLKEAESFFADMIGTLVEKITGVVTSDRKEVIIYLLEKGISESGQSKRFVLHVSLEDKEMVEEKKAELISLVKEGTELEIIVEERLDKNQCFIETESKIIDVSLDVQLRTLMEDLKMLSVSQ